MCNGSLFFRQLTSYFYNEVHLRLFHLMLKGQTLFKKHKLQAVRDMLLGRCSYIFFICSQNIINLPDSSSPTCTMSKQVYYVQLELHSCSVKMANVCTRELRAKHTLYVYSAEQINFHQKGANVEASLATLNSGGRELRLLTATLEVFLIKSWCWLILF